MWIDREETSEALPVATIPGEFLAELLKCAIVDYKEDECHRIITQQIPLGPLSVWYQKVHPKKDMKLRPQTPFRNLILHFMMGSDVIALIKEDRPVLLGSGFMDLFNLTSYPNEAPLQKDQDFTSFHLNIQPKKVKELVKMYPEVAWLKDKKVMQTNGQVNMDSQLINDVCLMAIRDIITCRYIGDAAHFYLLRQSVNILAVFHKLMDKPAHGLSENNLQKINECFSFLKMYYVGQHSVKQLAAMFGINARVLHEGFEAVFGCTPGQFQFDRRMWLAYKAMMETKASFETIAELSGFKSARSFRISFRRYYKCDPVWLVRAQ